VAMSKLRWLTVKPTDSLDEKLSTGRPLSLTAGVHQISREIPDRARIRAAGDGPVHVKGRITFGSRSVFSGMKMGDAGPAIRNRAGATDTRFENCQLRGGGGSGGDQNNLLLGNYANSCSDLTFSGCNIECTLGGYNNIRITENATDPAGAHVERITFKGCHIGVHNGVRKGCPRMDLEAYCDAQSGGTTYYHGYHDLAIVDCVFEASDWYNIDVTTPEADRPRAGDYHGSSGVRIRGCTLKGGKLYTICVESPTGTVIEGNTIYRGGDYTLKWGSGDMSTVDPGTIVRDNVIDTVTDQGIPASGNSVFYIRGGKNVVTDNRITVPAGAKVFYVEQAGRGNVTSPNTINGVVK
jgi:hypothetical protein